MSYRFDLDEYDEQTLVHELGLRRARRSLGLCDYCGREPTKPSCKFPERHRLDLVKAEPEPEPEQAAHDSAAAASAIGLYAVLARDVVDFIDMIRKEESLLVLRLLHEMLVTPNPNMSQRDAELNAIGAPFVNRELKRRLPADPSDESMFHLEEK